MHLYDNLIQESLNLLDEAVLRPLPLADGQAL